MHALSVPYKSILIHKPRKTVIKLYNTVIKETFDHRVKIIHQRHIIPLDPGNLPRRIETRQTSRVNPPKKERAYLYTAPKNTFVLISRGEKISGVKRRRSIVDAEKRTKETGRKNETGIFEATVAAFFFFRAPAKKVERKADEWYTRASMGKTSLRSVGILWLMYTHAHAAWV